ncbi:uncharacterized protein LOC113213192 isoform X1 [Frankliniella occidentalis]|uniref:Uncharacterized protein LOC113213192 isoform X1 n=1 Tax=Frankliniella occidentalis TaxID=133901 RepID=A0A9C6U1B0_FRAOC|nr:uncharacterized protein LOC113213192 isoform X1 [Frankliniella occidentalis]XP_052125577.1 uncharacterized protein LOC113213192 isoform X1 [Frankliniella occidentalis]
MLPPPSAPLRPEPGGSLALRGQLLGDGLVERCDGAADSDDTWSSSSADSGGEVSEAGPIQALATTPMSFGDIAVENSSEVYIGTTHIHMAPGSHVTVAYPNGRHAALATADHDRHLPAIVLPPVVQDLHLAALQPAPGDDLHVPGVPPAGVQDLHLPDDEQPDGTAGDTAGASKTPGRLSVKSMRKEKKKPSNPNNCHENDVSIPLAPVSCGLCSRVMFGRTSLKDNCGDRLCDSARRGRPVHPHRVRLTHA